MHSQVSQSHPLTTQTTTFTPGQTGKSANWPHITALMRGFVGLFDGLIEVVLVVRFAVGLRCDR